MHSLKNDHWNWPFHVAFHVHLLNALKVTGSIRVIASLHRCIFLPQAGTTNPGTDPVLGLTVDGPLGVYTITGVGRFGVGVDGDDGFDGVVAAAQTQPSPQHC